MPSNPWDAPSTKILGPGQLEALVREAKSADDAPPGARMSGSLDAVPLGDLLQHLLERSARGVVIVRGEQERGEVFLLDGMVTAASWEGEETLSGLDAVRRAGRLEQGRFWFCPDVEPPKVALQLTACDLFAELLTADEESGPNAPP